MKSMSKIKKVISVKEVPDKRFPDFGPCDISNWVKFLKEEKNRVLNEWNKPLRHEETISDFEQVTWLGSGSFGSVILIKDKKNRKFYAMKAISKCAIMKYKQLNNIECEKRVLQCINFPFTVYLKFCFKDNSYVYIVMPFIPGGELFELLRKYSRFKEYQAKFYVSQVILALEYLHNLDVIYRDIKPENILLDHTGYIKVADFGFCKRLPPDHRTYTLCGTPDYLAPEVILSKGYGKAVDWWSVGVLMYELVAGCPPFNASSQIKAYKKIVAGEYRMPYHFSSELKDLVQNILQVDLSLRYGNLHNGVKDIKKHKWFESINWMSVLNKKVEVPYQPAYMEPGDTINFPKKSFEQLNISNENLYPEEFSDF